MALGRRSSLDLPRPFGSYTLLRRLAVGGMAEVYVAKTQGIGGFEKLVAIKVIHPRFSEDDQFIQMLVDEAKLSVLLNHANIAQTFDLGRIDGTYFIVMEFVEGADTYRILKRVKEKRLRIPLDLCAYIASELCHGLDYAHRKRDSTGTPLDIVHRDVSPQNVLVSFAGEVKVADFGIAKATQRTGQTEAGVIKGKYFYMSPEQAWADPLDARSDVFSAGIVLHELLTGEMVYEEDNLPKLLEQVRKARVSPPSKVRTDVPPELDAIVMKALAKEPRDRWDSAHDFGQALSQFLYRHLPSFTAARLAALMAELFPEEMQSATGASQLPSEERVLMPASTDELPIPSSTTSSGLALMKADEFRPDPTKSVIFGGTFEDDTKSEKKKAQRPFRAFDSDGYNSEATSNEIPTAKRSLDSIDLDEEENTNVQKDFKLSDAFRLATGQPSSSHAVPKSDLFSDTTAEDEDPAQWDDATVVDSGAAYPLAASPTRPKPSAPPPPMSGAVRAAGVKPRKSKPPKGGQADPSEDPLSFPSPVEPTPWPITPDLTKDSLPEPSKGIPDLSGWREASDVFDAPAAVVEAEPAPASPSRFRLQTLLFALFVFCALGLMAYFLRPIEDEPLLRVEVVSVPPGATLRVDGSSVPGRTPMVVEDGITVGTDVVLEASLDGYETWRRNIRVEAGETRHIAVLVPAPFSFVIASDPPGATIFVDGTEVGEAPVTLPSVVVGQSLNVRAQLEGHVTRSERLSAAQDDATATIRLAPAN